MYVGQSTRDLVAGELIERYGQEMLQAGDRMAALEEDMLALMEDLAPFLEHGQATFHDETMDLHWFDDGFNENGSGPVVPTPGLEPGTP